MRRSIFVICFMLLATFGVSAQEFCYIDNSAISNFNVERDDDNLVVTMDLDLSAITLGRDETLVLTPYVIDDLSSVTLPSLELRGRRAYIYFLRDGELSVEDNTFATMRVAKRAKRKDSNVISYGATVSYESWMRQSSLLLCETLYGCDRWLGENVASLGDYSLEVYAPSYVWTYVAPDFEPVKVRYASHTAYINFLPDYYNILENYKNNSRELAGIMASIAKVDDDKDLTITSITIDGWASPEANEKHNMTLSHNRANSLADYISAKTSIDRSRIEAVGRGEDWVGLRKLVDATPGLLYRDQVYAIIDREDLTLDQKDYKLSQIKPKDIYTRLFNEMYPKLRRNDYKIVYEVRNFDLDEARALVDSDPTKLSVSELFRVADSYEYGSAEYRHVVEVAAEHYPAAVAVAISAARLAIEEGHYAEAMDILGRSNLSDARILAAQGYVCLMLEDYDQAYDLLSRAAAEGHIDAKHNLAELEQYIQSL